MLILQTPIPIPVPPRNLSSSRVLSGSNHFCLIPKFANLTVTRTTTRITPIRMGGGPRTFPGGVSKWQWKRMQASKAKQLLKARLARERQIYEMRKRAELKAAVTELERPWEVVEKAPKLFSVKADEQVKVLADRFQRPGGFDMWSEKDGPELFTLVDGVPSARFFPKGVVHSVKPYGKIKGLNENEKLSLPGSVSDTENVRGRSGYGNSEKFRDGSGSGSDSKVEAKSYRAAPMERNANASNSKFRKPGKKTKTGFKDSNSLNELVSEEVGVSGPQKRETPVRRNGHIGQSRRRNHPQKLENPDSEVYDMSLQDDGSYGF